MPSKIYQNNWFLHASLCTCTFYVLVLSTWIESKITSNNENYIEYYATKENTHATPDDNLKNILIWTNRNTHPLNIFEDGQTSFIKSYCPNINCYITTNTTYLSDIKKFDAVLFGPDVALQPTNLPNSRSPHQVYIFMSMDPSDNTTHWTKDFDGFFNWTATYRIDSEVPIYYLKWKNRKGQSVSPMKDVNWTEATSDILESYDYLVYTVANRVKAAAWYISSCVDKIQREELVKSLQDALLYYDMYIDIYGKCGSRICTDNECRKKLATDYLFYIAFENTVAKDYVTEKVLMALTHNTIPIVYGGANYSMFLPPSSYLSAVETPLPKLAKIMHELMLDRSSYLQYFSWKKLYTFINPQKSGENMCELCAALHNKNLVNAPRVYRHFRKWWNVNTGGTSFI